MIFKRELGERCIRFKVRGSRVDLLTDRISEEFIPYRRVHCIARRYRCAIVAKVTKAAHLDMIALYPTYRQPMRWWNIPSDQLGTRKRWLIYIEYERYERERERVKRWNRGG